MYVVNPESNRPIKIGSRVYKSLVRRGVLCPDDTLQPPKLVRSKHKYVEEKPEEDLSIPELTRQEQYKDCPEDMKHEEVEEEKEEEKEEEEEEEEEEEDAELMQRVAQCAADSLKDSKQYEGLNEVEMRHLLEELIIKALTSSSSSS